jgi:undecaprenyl-diphosphatase
MKKEKRKPLYITACFWGVFALWTVLVAFVDVKPIGPENSRVGFAAINGYFHNLTGVNMALYEITDWLSFIPLLFVAGFGLLGLCQWIHRKNLVKVDFSILALGGFYIATLAFFVLFEMLIINYRPVLIEGVLEPSYPSSTTMLALCVMVTAMMQLRSRIRHSKVRLCITVSISIFTAFMVIGRLLSGVHWLTDIIGGMLLSAALVTLYGSICSVINKEEKES